LNTFIQELEKYEFIDAVSPISTRLNLDTENSQRRNPLKSSCYSSLNNSGEILKKKNISQFRPTGTFSKKVFNKYTSPYGQYFDPKLQYGGESIYNDKNNPLSLRCNTTESESNSTLSPRKGKNKNKTNKSCERIDFDHDRKVYEYKENPWTSTQEFFL